MIPKLKEIFPNTEFSFMYITPSETKGFYYLNNDLNLEYIEKQPIDRHKKIKILGISFSIKTNDAPETLQCCILNKSFKEILSVMPFGMLVAMYYPYHEADEMKTIEKIKNSFPAVSALKVIRQKRKLTQEQLALLSGVNIRSIRSYEQGDNDISKAQGDTLRMLAKALDCTIEELLQ